MALLSFWNLSYKVIKLIKNHLLATNQGILQALISRNKLFSIYLCMYVIYIVIMEFCFYFRIAQIWRLFQIFVYEIMFTTNFITSNSNKCK